MSRTNYRILLLLELFAAFALPVFMLLYGVVIFGMMLASSLPSLDRNVIRALLLLATYIGLGSLGLWAILRLAIAEMSDVVVADRRWKILISVLAGLIGWTIVSGGPPMRDDGIILHILFWAPIVVGVQLLIPILRRAQQVGT